MKYIVRKPMPGAKVGDILKPEAYEDIPCLTQEVPVTCLLIGEHNIQDALDQGFIEPYEEKPKRWRAQTAESWWFVNEPSCKQAVVKAYEEDFDTPHHTYGNYFKSKETATAVAEALELFFEWLHTPLEVTASKECKHWADMYDAMNKARELVLADNEVSDE